MKRWLPFLILNVLISAATMIAVLLIWQVQHPFAYQSTADLTFGTRSVTRIPVDAIARDASIEIQNVIGAGDLNLEAVTLKNTGKSAVSLSGWTLKSDGGKEFDFPAFTVYSGGAFQVFSRSGVNTSLELYWGSTAPLWSSGARVMLLDPGGAIRQEFNVP